MLRADPLAVDRRIQPRSNYSKMVDYALESAIKGKLLRGITVNLSETGVCFYVFSPHAIGQRILITSVLNGRFRTGEICWCKKIDDGIYKAGVMFCEHRIHRQSLTHWSRP